MSEVSKRVVDRLLGSEAPTYSAPKQGVDLIADKAGISAQEASKIIQDIAKETGMSVDEVIRKNIELAPTGESGAGEVAQDPSQLRAFWTGAVDTMALGYQDEAASGLAAAINPQNLPGDFSERYRTTLDAMRARDKADEEAYPKTKTAGQIAGVAPMIASAPARIVGNMIAKGPTAVNRMARATGVGGTTAAVAGGGGSEKKDAFGIAEDVATSGVAGAILGPLGQGGGEIGQGLWNTGKNFLSKRRAGEHRLALDAAEEIAGAGTPEGIAAINKAGPRRMMVDASPEAISLLDATMQSSPPARKLARSRLEPRYAGASDDFTKALDDTLGAPVGPDTRKRLVARETAAARSEAYGEAYHSPINYASKEGDDLLAVIDRVPDSLRERAMKEANDEMRMDGLKNLQVKITIDDLTGEVSFSEMDNVQQLDYLKRALQRIGKETQDGKATSAASSANRLARDLRDSLSRLVPSYGVAVQRGADKIALEDAVSLGFDALTGKVRLENLSYALEGMPDVERQMVASAMRDKIEGVMAATKRGVSRAGTPQEVAEAMKGVRELSSRENEEKMRAIIGDEAADNLYRVIDETMGTLGLRGGLATQSKTAPRQFLNDRVTSGLTEGAWNKGLMGEGLNSLRSLWREGTGRTPEAIQKLSDEQFTLIADILTRPNPERALAELVRRDAIPEAAATAIRDAISRSTLATTPTAGEQTRTTIRKPQGLLGGGY